MATTDFAALLNESIREHTGYEVATYPKKYPMIFHRDTTKTRFVDVQMWIPYGLPGERVPGQTIAQGEIRMDWSKRFIVRSFGLGDVLAQEDLDDDPTNLLLNWTSSRGGAVGRSFVTLEEREAAAYLGTTGFTATSPAPGSPDGDSLFSTSHPTSAYDTVNTLSNRPSSEIDLSMAALQAARANLEQQMSSNGVTIQENEIARIIVNPNEAETAYQLQRFNTVSTANDPTADLSQNTMKGTFDVIVWPYFRRTGATAATNAWNAWIAQGKAHQLYWYDREQISHDQDKDVNTRSVIFTHHRRFTLGHVDWRGMYGSLGV